MSNTALIVERGETRTISLPLIFLLALSCALIVANHYYAQPLVGTIGASIGIGKSFAGLTVTMTQIGYGFGLLFLVPLGDLIENRVLVVCSLIAAAIALCLMAILESAPAWFASAFALGLSTSVLQLLLPYAAELTPPTARGRVIAALTSGIMLGIMLARPIASFITFYYGWRAVYLLSAASMVVLAALLRARMPIYQPHPSSSYGGTIRTLPALLCELAILRRRAIYHTALFASFSMFWVAVPLILAGPSFGLSQEGIGLFGLAGAGGVLVSPFAGWLADRGYTKLGTGLAILSVIGGVFLAQAGIAEHSITMVVVAAIVIDAGLVTNFVLSQRLIYIPRPDSRSRIGGLFTAVFFVGGAAGSAAATAMLETGGSLITFMIASMVAAMALIAYATELLPHSD